MDRMSVGATSTMAQWQVKNLRRALMEPVSITLHQDTRELTAKVLIEGTATGTLLGGNLDMIGTAVGWACPSFTGAILLIEDVDKPIGRIDRTITQLLKSDASTVCEGGRSGPVHSLGRREARQVVGR